MAHGEAADWVSLDHLSTSGLDFSGNLWQSLELAPLKSPSHGLRRVILQIFFKESSL